MKNLQLKTVLIAGLCFVTEVSAATFWSSLGFNGDVVSPQHTITTEAEMPAYSKRMKQITNSLANQLKDNHHKLRMDGNSVVVASIVDLDNPKETNRIGRSLSSGLVHELQTRGYDNIHFQLMMMFQVTDERDCVTSNDVTELRNDFDITYMLAGTLSEHSDGMTITMRLTDWETSVVVSTAQAFITTDEYFGLMSDMEISRPVVKVIRHNVPMPDQRVMKIR
jgi:TolB-like protein